MAAAIDQASDSEEVWVQAGTYGPITLKNAVRIIGGFAGTETAASQSDPVANVTVIDGNGSRAVLSDGNGPSTMLRGFTVKNGRVTGFGDGGGGMLVKDSAAMVVQCVFQDNTADFAGGAVSVAGAASPQFINCIFRNNGVMTIGSTTVNTIGGAAVLIDGGSPTLTNCLIHDNNSGDGAGIAIVEGSVTIHNCTIANNHATVNAGGGIFDVEGAATIKNSIIWGNTAVNGSAQIFNGTGVVSTVTKSNVQGGYAGTDNIDYDPLFTNSGSGDFTLQTSSPCKDKVLLNDLTTDVADLDWDTLTSEKIPLDLKLGVRRVNIKAEMGCYETGDSGGGGAQ